ncbi:hypothetical protein [Actinopolymorpha alba]|uniref:hypothetical protein n=1 Tax=Actinopolymorpha alba TaxID=533267 RepID=UPI0003730835|nr:hypothetical protein [Actinopolymorpha alba]
MSFDVDTWPIYLIEDDWGWLGDQEGLDRAYNRIRERVRGLLRDGGVAVCEVGNALGTVAVNYEHEEREGRLRLEMLADD